jgi:hypothetical protein
MGGYLLEPSEVLKAETPELRFAALSSRQETGPVWGLHNGGEVEMHFHHYFVLRFF